MGNIEYIELLREMISLPSFSKEEDETARLIYEFLGQQGVKVNRLGNNIWATNLYYDPHKPTVLLNSHHDTVRPNSGYTRDPFSADVIDGKLYGLGSNDAGGSVVSLLATFVHFYQVREMSYNLVIAITAQEECSGSGGIESLLPTIRELSPEGIAFAIVGEPTKMEMAIAERGLMVVDCVAQGVSGHAARETGVNAIYRAMEDIRWFEKYEFPLVSPLFGEVKMNVTMINSGSQHNVIPDRCGFTVDIRITEMYTHERVLEIIRESISSTATPRSMRLRASSIDPSMAIVKAGLS
ncbi:MAG: M20/M25/M40 family metallo-hydrolase, partial [Rikenellaceae bacterium]